MRFLAVYVAPLLLACSGPSPDSDLGASQREPVTKSECNFASAREDEELSSEELAAISVSENFVALNGYTSVPGEPARLTRESVEFASDPNEILRYRRNTLCPRAARIVKTADGWLVFFNYSQPTFSRGGTVFRAVNLDSARTSIFVEHQDVSFALPMNRN